MNRAHPKAEAIAVRGSRTAMAVGSVAELATWGDHTVDDRFVDKVLVPGFIEAHSHVMTGGVWQNLYVGFFDSHGADSRLWAGCRHVGEVVERLMEAEEQLADPNETLIAWGLDPIYFDPDDRLLAHHLDRVSETRPIFVYHASGHLATANSALMAKEEITEHTTTPGVARYANGQPNGELQEPAAMSLASEAFGEIRRSINSAEAKWNYGYEARMADIVSTYHEAGITVHCHCNGDEAAEVFIDAVEEAQRRHPRHHSRHTVQHCQLTTPAQYKRMAAMGMCANIFSNHMFYWGDQHRDFTVGPERAEQMDACTAADAGVSFSIHSDAPVTPLGPLHVAWCAVNRLTSTGKVLGTAERISVDQPMRAVTIDAAYQLKLDHEIGSLEAGKLADFAALDADPYDVDPVALNDVGVCGTAVGGVLYPSDRG